MAKIVENALVIYTDGSCHPKGRKGGYSAVFYHYDEVGNETEIDYYVAPMLKGTTNQRMELEAVVTGLGLAPTMPCYDLVNSVVVRSDSQYVVKFHYYALTHWRNNKWCNREGRPVDNADLWKNFVRAYHKIRKPIDIQKVKGHGRGKQKDPNNYRADELAGKSSTSLITRDRYRSSVRRKLSPKKTVIGSIKPEGQELLIRVIENLPMKVQRTYAYSTDTCHLFHVKPATQTGAKLPPVPRDVCHPAERSDALFTL